MRDGHLPWDLTFLQIVVKIAMSSLHSIKERRDSIRCDNLGIDQQIQPVIRFFQLFQALAQFGHEFSIGSGAISFTEIRSNRCPRSEHLIPKHVGVGPFRQGGEQPNDAQRELLSSHSEINSLRLLAHPSSLIPDPTCPAGSDNAAPGPRAGGPRQRALPGRHSGRGRAAAGRRRVRRWRNRRRRDRGT
jgi:hypothetical protein